KAITTIVRDFSPVVRHPNQLLYPLRSAVFDSPIPSPVFEPRKRLSRKLFDFLIHTDLSSFLRLVVVPLFAAPCRRAHPTPRGGGGVVGHGPGLVPGQGLPHITREGKPGSRPVHIVHAGGVD